MRSQVGLFLTAFFLFQFIGCADDSDMVVPVNPAPTIHVSTTGSDRWDGSADQPVFTISRALELVSLTLSPEIKIAHGYYMHELHLVGGMDIIGGLDPQTWEAVPGQFSIISNTNHSVLGQDIQVPTHISGLQIHTSVSRTPLMIFGCSAELQFVNCRFIASDSQDGETGNAGWSGHPLNTYRPELEGGPGHCSEDIPAPGGSPLLYTHSSGGDGGSPGEPGADGQDASYRPGDQPDSGLAGEGGLPGQPGQDGMPGADGTDGENGELASIRIYIQGTDLRRPDTERARNGHYGYFGGGGGGGGGSINGTGNGGGAGGDGGPYGNGGNNGRNAYPSIAVISSNSLARFTNCFFHTGNAGDGGTGGEGIPGFDGIEGGPGGTECSPEVGAGGNGGDGGTGGSGGGGAGGHGGDNIGLWILGDLMPQVDDDCVFEQGEAGLGGVGGPNGNGDSNGPTGWDGRRVEILIESETP